MENTNPAIVISIVISFLTATVLLWVAYKQFYEVLMPRDWLTRLRWLILAMLVVAIVGILPVITYQVCRLLGTENEVLRNVASVLGNLSRLAGAVLLMLIYRYKKED